jgi:hypothetical protein
MTRADVHRELIAIAKDGLRDPEAATSREREMLRDVLSVIGEEQSHAGDLARAALRTFELAFRRIG